MCIRDSYNGEDYYLQVDCHTRFRENWDELLIDNLEKYISVGNNCILTGYPPGYWYEEDGTEGLDLKSLGTRIVINKKTSRDQFKNNRTINQEAKNINNIFCSESISGGFIFGRGEIHKVKPHPGILYGEEFLQAMFFYCKGYNLMNPDVPCVFHLYGNNSKRIHPALLYPKECNKLSEVSKYVLKTLLSGDVSDISYKIWADGPRNIEMFGKYLNIDFKSGHIYG